MDDSNEKKKELFDALRKRLKNRPYAAARQDGLTHEEAEDVVSQMWTNAWEKWGQCREPDPVPWLFRILYNASKMEKRRWTVEPDFVVLNGELRVEGVADGRLECEPYRVHVSPRNSRRTYLNYPFIALHMYLTMEYGEKIADLIETLLRSRLEGKRWPGIKLVHERFVWKLIKDAAEQLGFSDEEKEEAVRGPLSTKPLNYGEGQWGDLPKKPFSDFLAGIAEECYALPVREEFDLFLRGETPSRGFWRHYVLEMHLASKVTIPLLLGKRPQSED